MPNAVLVLDGKEKRSVLFVPDRIPGDIKDEARIVPGQEAAKLLIRHIEVRSKSEIEAPAETKLLKTRLIVRESSQKKGKGKK